MEKFGTQITLDWWIWKKSLEILFIGFSFVLSFPVGSKYSLIMVVYFESLICIFQWKIHLENKHACINPHFKLWLFFNIFIFILISLVLIFILKKWDWLWTCCVTKAISMSPHPLASIFWDCRFVSSRPLIFFLICLLARNITMGKVMILVEWWQWLFIF